MANLSQISLIGHIGRDAELRTTSEGRRVVGFTLAVNERRYGDTETTMWFRVSLWGQWAEKISSYLTKGRQVYVSGKLSVRDYTDKQGNARTSLDVSVGSPSQFQLLDKKGEEGGLSQNRPPVVSEDDTPF